MEESLPSTILEGRITGIRFELATPHEISTSSISDCPISHASQLTNPFLGLPLESGKCESCGTAEPGQCEGHFGFIELPIPVYHPSHVSELKRLLSCLCLKCLKMKNRKFQTKSIGVLERMLSSCCEDASQISVNEVKTSDGACYLELKAPARSRLRDGFWNFLEKYGFRYGDNHRRPLLPYEAMVILKKISEDTRKKLSGKGYFPQEGYILQYLPVPPNCLSVPDISDGISVMSSDHSLAMLKKVLKQIEIIKSSRSGEPNFEAHEVEANDLQAAVVQYLQVRGMAKASRDVEKHFGLSKELGDTSTKAWLEKMKTLFIRKGSGFSSRSVITGDAYKGVNEIGLPLEIAQKITFEERVTLHNVRQLQKLVDEKLCLTYRDGSSTYSLREGSKGHTFLRPGQVVHRRIVDGDLVFINRPPTTHKHSLQALSVYVHDDHTVKINPLICGPLSADFDGDCVHLFYPQSLAAKAEVLELFSVEKQLLSSHTGNFNLQLTTDSLLSLKFILRNHFLNKATAQQLSMFVSNSLPQPAMLKASSSGPFWTALQILQTALPAGFDCNGEGHLIRSSEILGMDINRETMQSIVNEVVTSILFGKGPVEVLRFFNSVQPLLMENLFSEGFSVGLQDFFVPREMIDNIETNIQQISHLLYHLRSVYNESVELQLENYLWNQKFPVVNFILQSSAMGSLIDSKSDSSINKVAQQIGFLGLQLSDRGKFYTRSLVNDMAALFWNKYPFPATFPSEEFGLVRSCLFHGLDPYQEMVHSISSREVIVRSSRGLTEPGTLFKNLMAILRDVVICYDGTVRNVCSNSIIQFEYGFRTGNSTRTTFAAGEPVGVLAATAMSNPAYKAVLDSSPSSNSSWEMMKEILLCGVNFKNVVADRRVILYLNDCGCGRRYCRENAAYLVKNQLKKVSLKDVAVEFLIEYRRQQNGCESSEGDAGLWGHIHLNKVLLKDSKISMLDVLDKCQDAINSLRKKKRVGPLFRRLLLSFSECCSFHQPTGSKVFDMPCLNFFLQDTSDQHLERTSQILADTICPVLLETIIRGDPRVQSVNIIWISPDTTTWIRNPWKSQKGELALDVVLEKEAVKQSGDAWRIVLDSCLPIIHLIDTRRSIPYAIKQIQELLGVSCAFEQAVQRLSTSVTMVTKGVLKEHLILLANSMTCAGNLVGFNIGGIKALSRLLNVQVPFTEATLFTPKKCFERAAEKLHVDNLSSIVASCSWGKHVAVGTGSRFDVLWDTREVKLNEHEGVDVYSFLHLLRSGTNGEDTVSACLGEEIEDLDLEADNVDLIGSPEQDSALDRPTFEDAVDMDFGFVNQKLNGSNGSKSRWEKASLEVEPGGWEQVIGEKQNMGTGIAGSLSNWGTLAGQREDISSVSTKDDVVRSRGWDTVVNGNGQKQSETSSAWGRKVEEAEKPKQSKKASGNDSSKSKLSSWSNWGTAAGQKLDISSTSTQDDTARSSGWDMVVHENQQKQLQSSAGWGRKVEEAENPKHSEMDVDGQGKWASRAVSKPSDWFTKDASGGTEDDFSKPGGWNAVETGDGNNQSGSWPISMKKNKEVAETGWGKKENRPLNQTGGLAPADFSKSGGWNAVESRDGNNQSAAWPVSAKKNKEVAETGWGKKESRPLNQTGGLSPADFSKSGGWNAVETEDGNNQLGSWPVSANKSKEVAETGWGKKENRPLNQTVGLASKPGGWNAVETEDGNNQSGSWPVSAKMNNEVAETGWGKEDNRSLNQTGGLAPSDFSKSGEWNAVETEDGNNQSGSWPVSAKRNKEVAETGWGKKENRPLNQTGGLAPADGPCIDESSRGWGANAGNWKNKRNLPPKSVGGFKDDSCVAASFTATRQRLDSFTSEEQDMLLDVEPILLSIRRIMHQSRYNDGDPLSAEDQSYILDNVFNYHPDKAGKMGTGIDHITINKHSSFQDSRCFYVISTDGRSEDFSYRKCLENFMKGRYPEKAEAFIAKYFRKPHPRSGWNRERSVAPEEQGAENRV